jgi:hypothetical protein
MASLPALSAAVAMAAATLLPAHARGDGGALVEDRDQELLDLHFSLHLGGNAASGVFGTVALVGGIENFVRLGQGEPTFFPALTLTTLGVATVISSVTGAEATVGAWKEQRLAFAGAPEATRRIIRESEAVRLQRIAVNRAIGLAADATFFGIGLALIAVSPSYLGLPLVLDGGFLMGLDLFRLIVDDQAARAWRERNRAAEAGYFTSGTASLDGDGTRRRGPPRARMMPMPVHMDRGGMLLFVGSF